MFRCTPVRLKNRVILLPSLIGIKVRKRISGKGRGKA
jgi:hypothetical protein